MSRPIRRFPLAVLAAWLLVCVGRPALADMVATIERVKPSVVMVGIFNKLGSPQLTLRGTGFVVGDGRTVATNAHVVANRNEQGEPGSIVVQVTGSSSDQRMRQAQVWVIDQAHDLALLKIGGTPLPTLSLSDSDTVREGQSIAFMGFPIGGALGFSPVTHRGMVSAVTAIALPSANAQQLKEAVIRRLKSGSFDVFQLDATAYPGNSGGPMFDAETGGVVGIINMVLVKGTKEAILTHPSGISYAIPANYLRTLLTNTK